MGSLQRPFNRACGTDRCCHRGLARLRILGRQKSCCRRCCLRSGNDLERTGQIQRSGGCLRQSGGRSAGGLPGLGAHSRGWRACAGETGRRDKSIRRTFRRRLAGRGPTGSRRRPRRHAARGHSTPGGYATPARSAHRADAQLPSHGARASCAVGLAQSRSCRGPTLCRYDRVRRRYAGRNARTRGGVVGAGRRRRKELRNGMRAVRRIVMLAVLATFTSALAACSDFDTDKLDVFGLNEKKKLPGERKELFPNGVPGVTQGVPPEYVKGYQPPPDSVNADAALQSGSKVNPGDASAALKPEGKTTAVEPADAPKPKPKRKPNLATAQRAPAQVTIQRAGPGQFTTSPPQQSPWPEPNQQ